MRFHAWLSGLLAALVMTATAARAEMVRWDEAHLKQLQAEDRFVVVEFTSFR